MENERFERGLAALRKANEKGLADLVQSMDAVAPDLARFVIEFAYGDIYTRPGLLPNSANYALSLLSRHLAIGSVNFAITFRQRLTADAHLKKLRRSS